MIRNDITKVAADAIVNPANRNLLQGSGTSRAIYQAAGEQELTAACEAIGYCEPGGCCFVVVYSRRQDGSKHSSCGVLSSRYRMQRWSLSVSTCTCAACSKRVRRRRYSARCASV